MSEDWAEFNAATSTIDSLRPAAVRSPLASPRAPRRVPPSNENAYGELRAPPLPPRKSLSPGETGLVSAESAHDIRVAKHEPRRRSLEPEPDVRHRLTSVITGSTETITGIIDTRHEVPPDPRSFEKPRRACTPQTNSRPLPAPPLERTPPLDPTNLTTEIRQMSVENRHSPQERLSQEPPNRSQETRQNYPERIASEPRIPHLEPRTVTQPETLPQVEHRLVQPPESRIQHSESRIQHLESRTQHSESRIQHSESRPQLPEPKIQHSEPRPQLPEPRIQHAERAQHSEARLQHLESRIQQSEARVQHSELRLQQSESRLQHSESRVQQSESRAQLPEPRTQHPEPRHTERLDHAQARIPSSESRSNFVSEHKPSQPPRQRSLPTSASIGDVKPTKSVTMPKFPSQDIKDPQYENVEVERREELAAAAKKFNPLTHDKHGRKYGENVSYENINLDYIARLVGEGYPKDIVVRALGITRNDLEMACDILHEFGAKVPSGC